VMDHRGDVARGPKRERVLPERCALGGILVTDPTVQAFIERLAHLMADPEAFGANETIGPVQTPVVLGAA
ncbi:MAG: hypothetical protein M3457_17860, partial [Chloroflexota bacterium]|nr:hypothetical protein [Chloroflexota bacterium]